ncbi:MAG: hypothetical protein KGI35_11335 [Burkholderiales bacterium]|nr:hypothetical protein [Burkholderiales bacterium]
MTSDYRFPDDIGTARHDDDVGAVLAAIRQRGLPPAPIAFYGSSSFRLWQSMAADLGCLDVVNLGFGGATHASALHHLDRLLTPLRPTRVVLYFGENDISADGLDARSTLGGLRALLDAIRQRMAATPVFVLSAKQSPTKWTYADVVAEFNRLAAEHCRGLDGVHPVDVTSVLLGAHGRPLGRHYQDDLIHLNASGYLQWARILRAQPGLFG